MLLFRNFLLLLLTVLLVMRLQMLVENIDGSISIGGKWNQTHVEGELFLDQFRLSVPYLNVGYRLVDGSKLIINPESIQFEPTYLMDENNLTTANF